VIENTEEVASKRNIHERSECSRMRVTTEVRLESQPQYVCILEMELEMIKREIELKIRSSMTDFASCINSPDARAETIQD
jgi:hypothetical protein